MGYLIGSRAGPRLFQREDSFWFRREHLERARRFYEKHGGKTIVLARFIVGIRTFAPVVAGATNMPYRRFASYNVIGGVCWVFGLTLLAFSFGGVVRQFDHYIFLAVIVILPLPLIIGLVQAYRLHRARARYQKARQAPH